MVYPRHAVTSIGGCCIPDGIPPTTVVMYFTANDLGFCPKMYIEHPIARELARQYPVSVMGTGNRPYAGVVYPLPKSASIDLMVGANLKPVHTNFTGTSETA